MKDIMIAWKSKFSEETLERGMALYESRKVTDLKNSGKTYSAAILGRVRYEVSARLLDSGALHMSCRCPMARSGRNCEHMAALMWAVEASSAEEKTAEERRTGSPAANGDRAEKAQTEEASSAGMDAEMPLEQWRRFNEELQKQKKAAKTSEKAGTNEPAAKTSEKAGAKGTSAKTSKKAGTNEPAAEKPRRGRRKKETPEEKAAREKAEAEARAAEEKAAAQAKAEEERREARRQEREKRKAEQARKKEELKRQAEEAARIEREKRQAEEARRQKLREEKEELARRKAEKRQKEQEATRIAQEKRRQEKLRRAEEEKRQREEEEQRMREEMRRAEEARLQKEKEKMALEQRKNEFTLLGGSWNDPEEDTAGDQGTAIQALEEYRYFDAALIRDSVAVSDKTIREAEKLIRAGNVRITKAETGHERTSHEAMGQIRFAGMENKREVSGFLLFSRYKIENGRCTCSKCSRDFFYQFDLTKIECPYKAGALLLLEDLLSSQNLGDATDVRGTRVLADYEERHLQHVISDAAQREESLKLVPKLTRKDGELSVSFRVGEGKLFVVKKLDVFCENVRNSVTDTYGSSTEINHDLKNFTESGKKWYRFLDRIVREEREFLNRMMRARDYYGRVKESVGASLQLFGWRLDEFFEQLGSDAVDFEDKDNRQKKKGTLSCASRNPRVTVKIRKNSQVKDRQFHGICVEGKLPELYYGSDHAYYITENHLNRVEKSFLEKAEPLANIAVKDRFSFCVGRNSMAGFYSAVLPQLQEIADVTEEDPELFRSFVPPEPRFSFYLDIVDGDAICQIYVAYGDREFSVVESVPKQKEERQEPFRDEAKEQEIFFFASQWLPLIDAQKDALCCDGDEWKIYQLMKNGTEKLMEMGEVHCTKRFLDHHGIRRARVSVGVSVSSGLLELNVSTEDVPEAELLDILKSYRTKKKYYRLKSGAFVDLEDPSLEMLAELSQAMNLKDKEFLKGKLKLPMYRTLYLDKLLEENESVYSTRDSRFREVVKEFKTVKDADFEEPSSLSKIMRKYQKDGYKWLRTLEAWQFGGILADDMGLGKTLQVIAVLLAAKEEEKEGVSLVVTPASLVFNWGAEFEKYAPDLRVTLVTGNQEERQKKIEAYREADVLVTSYDLLKRDIGLYEDKDFLYEVIDEAQYIKNHTTAAAKAVKVIHSRIRYALTGTPIENRLSELWSIFDYLMPGLLYTYEVFRREIETPIVKNEDEKAMKRLQRMTGPFILRRLKEDVLKDLPEKLEECRYVRLGDTQQKTYDAQVLHMRELIAAQNKEEFDKNKLQILAELTRLRQICCDPSLCFENYRGETAKLEACLELIQSAMDGGHRMLVFSQFTSMLEILQEKLTEQGIPFFTITGSVSKKKRLDLVREFNEGSVPVFLISLKAGGVGLNLIGADVVIHYDPWWNLAAQNQATDRAHRIGQSKKVTVYKLIARHTIEEKIQKLQETKKNLADQVMSGESGSLGSMSQEEILELLEV